MNTETLTAASSPALACNGRLSRLSRLSQLSSRLPVGGWLWSRVRRGVGLIFCALRVVSAGLMGLMGLMVYAMTSAMADDAPVLLDVSSLPPSGSTGGTQFESLRPVDGVLYYVEYVVSDTDSRASWELLRFDPAIAATTRPTFDPGDSQQGPQRPERLTTMNDQLVFVAPYKPIATGSNSSGVDRVGLWQAPVDQFRIDFATVLSRQADRLSFESIQVGNSLVLSSIDAGIAHTVHSLFGSTLTDVITADLQQSEQIVASKQLSDKVLSLSLAYEASSDGFVAQLWSFPASNGGSVKASLVRQIVDPSLSSGLPSLPGSVAPAGLWRVANKVLFFANDLVHGCELWVSDGTTSGTRLLKEINTGIGDSVPSTSTCQTYAPNQSGGQRAVVRNGLLYFYAFDGVQEQLWQSDGTSAGTYPVAKSFVQHYSPFSIQARVNGWTYYAVNESGVEVLWRTNGEALYTEPVSAFASQGSLRVTELAVTAGSLFILTQGGDVSQLWEVSPRTRAPQATVPIELTLRERESNDYGARYGLNEHPQRVVFSFNSNDGLGALLTAKGYDIDSATEVQVRLNGNEMGYLKVSPNNALGKVSRFELPADKVNAGANTLEFVQQKVGYKYGVTNIRVVPLRGEQITLQVSRIDRRRLGYRYGGGSLYPQILPIQFARTASDAELKFRAFDIDSSNEVGVYLNSSLIARLPTTANGAERVVQINLPISIQQQSNLLEFRQIKAGYQWGVRNLLLRLL